MYFKSVFMTKICKKCDTEKELSNFYKHSGMSDGYFNYCKDCKKQQSLDRIAKLSQDEDWKEKERLRGREKYHRLYSTNTSKELDSEFNVVWTSDEEAIKNKRDSNKKWIKNNPESYKNFVLSYKNKYPEKYKARAASKRIYCPKGHERHHWSYNENYFKDVIILEKEVHSFLHRFIDYDQKAKIYRTSIKINQFGKNEPLDSKEKHLEFLEIIKKTLW